MTPVASYSPSFYMMKTLGLQKARDSPNLLHTSTHTLQTHGHMKCGEKSRTRSLELKQQQSSFTLPCTFLFLSNNHHGSRMSSTFFNSHETFGWSYFQWSFHPYHISQGVFWGSLFLQNALLLSFHRSKFRKHFIISLSSRNLNAY